jgi:hypothetical protein
MIDDTSEIIIYRAEDGGAAIDVRLEGETIWLTQKHIAAVFGTKIPAITKHIKNIIKSRELKVSSTVSKMEIVQPEGRRQVKRKVDFYNLDMVIAVGYRVNSRRATQFRIWATRVLREHLVKGFTVNEQRLKKLHQAVHLITEFAERRDLSGDEAKALLHMVEDYSVALNLLDDYDHQKVSLAHTTERKVHAVTYDEAVRTIHHLRNQFGASELFGREKDESLHSSLEAIFQTFEGRDVYPSLEEKAAHLLYFLVKNHSFVDGNKRIAAA